ncbi:hypothetical protein GE061_007979 [Apolygus lucorum]|uniref:Uncharacterized protein n=2 Tax=Mirini TaxID=236659 RepID=A0A8S9WN41_APOLU|nr:hypothetical protein GE061_007979 [Apolygus lucorum]
MMRGTDPEPGPDLGPDPRSESDSSDASLSPVAPLESPEDSVIDLPLDARPDPAEYKTEVRKRGGESSDSGKESDEENKMEEDYEREDEQEDEYEESEGEFQDCEGFEDRGEYSWNCYLTTIEEEEEEEVAEDEEELPEEEEDSGNDSDLEKSELETFEMLEKLCEIESKERGEKTERGRIQSYHEYKRLKETSPTIVVEYKNQIVVDKDVKGKIKPTEAKFGEFQRQESDVSMDTSCESWSEILGQEELRDRKMDFVEDSKIDTPEIRVMDEDRNFDWRLDDDGRESVLEIRVPLDFDSGDIPSPWMVHKSDLRTVEDAGSEDNAGLRSFEASSSAVSEESEILSQNGMSGGFGGFCADPTRTAEVLDDYDVDNAEGNETAGVFDEYRNPAGKLSVDACRNSEDSEELWTTGRNALLETQKPGFEGPGEPVDSNPGGRPCESIGRNDLRGRPPLAINTPELAVPLRPPMKHDPESKIKSALKRASSKKRKKHKVQFDESLNKFFEADYVILIREECGGGGCDCGGGDYCYAEDDDEDEICGPPVVQSLDLAPFDPPVEFVDQLTLSPPDGYKDHCIHHPPLPDDDKERWPPEEPKCEDGQTQTTPTSETEDNDGSLSLSAEQPEKKERYIVETITMTTVTERRIIREAEEAEGAGVLSHPLSHTMSHSASHPGSHKDSAASHLTSKDKEMSLSFKLGSNSLKPNSALRQLFPRIASPPPDKSPDSDDDSLQSNLIKRTIERNTLRRSLVRYPDIRKRAQAKKNENSLVERIKKLTCDIDDDDASSTPPVRSSPTGEESKDIQGHIHSSTAVVESSKVPAYRKITDIFIRNKEPHPVVLQAPSSVEHQYPYYQPYNPPDLGNGLPKTRQNHEARKQFLSSLAPLTACVSSNIDDAPGSRDSTSTVDTEYSLGDIDDVLKDQKPQPDIVVGTPGNESDELALFVQQDASRIERLRKRYSSAGGSDDEQDDYGFNRRPSVRGIKPRFGSTTEILQQMQSQIAPPLPSGSHVSWPYYPPEDRNGYRRYVEEPHYSQNVIHVQQGQSVRLPYQAGPVQVHLMGGPQSRQVVVRGTQTISTYYQIPRASPEQFPRGPLVYYPRSPICGSPTKMKLERGVPEGASASPHQEQAALPPPPGPPVLPQGPPVPAQTLPITDPPMMYAMNV